MKRSLVVEFTKMEGAGNDFIVIDNRFFRFTTEELAELAAMYCPRRWGIGADGLLALDPPDDDDADFRMRYRNADGSLGTMCGNGARCIAVFAHVSGVGGSKLVFDTDAGRYRAEISEDRERVEVWMPPPYPPLAAEPLALTLDGGEELHLYRLWTGTEHAVMFVEDLNRVDVARLGSALRWHDVFAPTGTNVNFVEVSGQADGAPVIRSRTFEKGVESETPACGTGAVAIAVTVIASRGLSDDEVRIEMPGGTLNVGLRRQGGQISSLSLEGPVRSVFRGTFEIG